MGGGRKCAGKYDDYRQDEPTLMIGRENCSDGEADRKEKKRKNIYRIEKKKLGVAIAFEKTRV